MARPTSTSLSTLLIFLFSCLGKAQHIGTLVPERHPSFPTQLCTASEECTTRQTFLVADALTRHFHAISDPSISCASFETISNATLCPDAATCAKNCALEGVEYGSKGVSAVGSAVTMRQYLFDGTTHRSVSPRLYLLAEGGEEYEMLRLLNQELAVDVDVSQLGCGMNGAVYLSEMEVTGNRDEERGNTAGAGYGVGYCDAQCFNTVSWINGAPNFNQTSGACCNEMDIWEANSRANVFTPHTCASPDGCGINTYNLGHREFYGPSAENVVDSSRPFTIITQFITDDDTSTGTLVEIKRVYVQDGKVMENSKQTNNEKVGGIEGGYNGVITEGYCAARNRSDFARLGGMEAMGEALGRGMVLVFSLWNSEGDFMSWLDGDDGQNGPCGETEGDPARIVRESPAVSVTFSNVRWGSVGSTFGQGGSSNGGSTGGGDDNGTGDGVFQAGVIKGGSTRLMVDGLWVGVVVLVVMIGLV
ncbi:putative endo-beta-1,4-glucanase celB [Podospora australis]|uniref:Glucanase n=1 Tax=Podospora australis TaxID=1536484 RepID=A0AAN6WHM4_9PEZI|nr:putative endo-beta-1,4-glucanase celB [Podospora australis]